MGKVAFSHNLPRSFVACCLLNYQEESVSVVVVL